jgi:c(7)-type cytochrome triheme protein
MDRLSKDRHRIWRVIPFVVLLLWSIPAAPASQDELKLPPDRAFDSRAGSPGAVNFSHATHVEFSDRNCLACHPSPFSILGRHREVTHEIMEGGGACGLCHDGRNAFPASESDSCEFCHRPVPTEAEEEKG